MATVQKTVTARVSGELHEAAHRLANQRGESVNTLIEKALEREVQEQEERDFYHSFTVIAQDTEANNIDFAVAAQAEVTVRA